MLLVFSFIPPGKREARMSQEVAFGDRHVEATRVSRSFVPRQKSLVATVQFLGRIFFSPSKGKFLMVKQIRTRLFQDVDEGEGYWRTDRYHLGGFMENRNVKKYMSKILSNVNPYQPLG